MRADDAFDVVCCYVEIVEEDEKGDDGMFWGEGALDGGFGVGFVAHFALDHADEVGAKDSSDGGYHVCDDDPLGGGQRLLDDFVDDVHDIVYGGGDVRGIRG